MRARNIKPSLFKNEALGEADPLLTILFEGLWCMADREGRLEYRPKLIKAEIFPYREITDIHRYLTELERLEFICFYTVENRTYIQVNNFLKHQSPHKTERASVLPAPPEKSESCCVTVSAPLTNESATVKESLIPDSLIPDSKDLSLSLSAHARAKPVTEPPMRQRAIALLEFLNTAAGTSYQPLPQMISPIVALLGEAQRLGYDAATIDDHALLVIRRCVERWGKEPHMAANLTPQTIFGYEKFWRYHGELGLSGPPPREATA